MNLKLLLIGSLVVCLPVVGFPQAGTFLDLNAAAPSPPSGVAINVSTASIVADFSFSPTSGAWPLTVQFNDLTQGGPTSWAWNFGDGGTSIVQHPVHTFNSAATFTVSLTATGPGGSSATNHNITVTNAPLWSRQYGGTSSDFGASIAVDSGGNYIIAGQFYSPSITFGTTTLVNAGNNSDIFLVKIDVTGTVVWAKRWGGSAFDGVNSVAVDSANNIYIGGNFAGTTDMGGGSVASVGANDIWVAKRDSSGNFVWGKTFGSTGNDALISLAVDTSNHLIITGGFAGGTATINFGGSALTGGQTYLVELSTTDGSHIWSQNFGSTTSSRGNGVKFASNGDILLVGQFDGFIDLATNILTSPHSATTMEGTLDSLGSPSQDCMIGRFNSGGGRIWSRSWGSPFADAATAVAQDGAGNIWTMGNFSGSQNVGCGTMSTAITAETDVFIAKLSSTGTCLYSTNFVGAGGSGQPAGLAVDGSNNMIVTGTFTSPTVTINGTSLSLASSGRPDFYVAKFTSVGALTWAVRYGGDGTCASDAILIDGSSNPVLTGTFSGSALIGSGQFTSFGAGDVFVVRLAP